MSPQSEEDGKVALKCYELRFFFNSVDILNQVDSPFPLRGVGEINFPKEKIHRYGSKQRVVQKCDFKTLPGSG